MGKVWRAIVGTTAAAVLVGATGTTGWAARSRGAPATFGATVEQAVRREPSQLAVLDATGGTYDGRRLVLTGVRPTADWFTDRPLRDAGTFGVAQLIDEFFVGQSAPNAAIVFAHAKSDGDVALVELSKPRYDRKARTVTMTARLLHDQYPGIPLTSGLDSFVKRDDARIPKRFDDVTVFVDSAPAPGLGAAGDDQYAALESWYQKDDTAYSNAIENMIGLIAGSDQLCPDASQLALQQLQLQLDQEFATMRHTVPPLLQQIATVYNEAIGVQAKDALVAADNVLAQGQTDIDTWCKNPNQGSN